MAWPPCQDALTLEHSAAVSKLSAQGLVSSDPTVGSAANCSFVGAGESQLVFCSFDRLNKEAGWPLFLCPGQGFRIFAFCLQHSYQGTFPSRLAKPLWLSTFLCALRMVWFIQELWGLLEKVFENAAGVEWLAIFYALETGTEVGEFPFLVWRSVVFCAESRAGLVYHSPGPSHFLLGAVPCDRSLCRWLSDAICSTMLSCCFSYFSEKVASNIKN